VIEAWDGPHAKGQGKGSDSIGGDVDNYVKGFGVDEHWEAPWVADAHIYLRFRWKLQAFYYHVLFQYKKKALGVSPLGPICILGRNRNQIADQRQEQVERLPLQSIARTELSRVETGNRFVLIANLDRTVVVRIPGDSLF